MRRPVVARRNGPRLGKLGLHVRGQRGSFIPVTRLMRLMRLMHITLTDARLGWFNIWRLSLVVHWDLPVYSAGFASLLPVSCQSLASPRSRECEVNAIAAS